MSNNNFTVCPVFAALLLQSGKTVLSVLIILYHFLRAEAQFL